MFISWHTTFQLKPSLCWHSDVENKTSNYAAARPGKLDKSIYDFSGVYWAVKRSESFNNSVLQYKFINYNILSLSSGSNKLLSHLQEIFTVSYKKSRRKQDLVFRTFQQHFSTFQTTLNLSQKCVSPLPLNFDTSPKCRQWKLKT